MNKKSTISLMSLSPEAVMGSRLASPLETPGTSKALEALKRVPTMLPLGQVKIAYKKAKDFNKKYLAPGLGGAATGALLASLIPPRGKDVMQLTKNNYKARLLGAAMGAAINILSKQAMLSPAMALRSTQRVGSPINKIKAGPKLSTQIRGSLLGHKGTIAGV